ncbi:hypothetical protein HZC09_06215 [Candidatus Micrarchaeota archaeon]|nr:hypothetical protein [Candidatus Micrarchaeota archaeon]
MYRFVLKHLFPKAHAQIEEDEKRCSYAPLTKAESQVLLKAPKKPLDDETAMMHLDRFVLPLLPAAKIADARLPVLKSAEALLVKRAEQRGIPALAASIARMAYANERSCLEKVISVRNETDDSLRKSGKTLEGVASEISSFEIFGGGKARKRGNSTK